MFHTQKLSLLEFSSNWEDKLTMLLKIGVWSWKKSSEFTIGWKRFDNFDFQRLIGIFDFS